MVLDYFNYRTIEKLDELEIVPFLMSFKHVVEKWSKSGRMR